jgi:uncharacterized membrane protein YphA (DoxX/SURF4 family)
MDTYDATDILVAISQRFQIQRLCPLLYLGMRMMKALIVQLLYVFFSELDLNHSSSPVLAGLSLIIGFLVPFSKCAFVTVASITTLCLHFGAGALGDQEDSTLCYDRDTAFVVAACQSLMMTGDESTRREVDESIQHDHPTG